MKSGTSKNCGILVVDDDPSLAGTLQECLDSEGYPVAIALSGGEALALLDRDAHIAIALIDLIMPQTDGISLMEEIHRRKPDMAVVIMTGFGTIEMAVEAMKRGAEDYITNLSPSTTRRSATRWRG